MPEASMVTILLTPWSLNSCGSIWWFRNDTTITTPLSCRARPSFRILCLSSSMNAKLAKISIRQTLLSGQLITVEKKLKLFYFFSLLSIERKGIFATWKSGKCIFMMANSLYSFVTNCVLMCQLRDVFSAIQLTDPPPPHHLQSILILLR